MGITEEQRRRAEANRLAALEKRKRFAEAAAATASTSYTTAFPASATPTFPAYDAAAEWRLAKCPRIAPPAPQHRSVLLPPRPSPPPPPPTPPQPPVGFKVVLEVCSPDEFLVAVGPAEDKAYPGEADCLGAVQDCLSAASVEQYSATQSQSQSGHLRPVFKLVDYDVVLKCLKRLPGAAVEDIPYNTRRLIQNIPMFAGQKWASDKEVDELLKKLPQQVKDALLPFQLEGVRFGLRRRGRCLIADEMGLGKTLQAIAIACCFKDEGSILIVCPAVLRYTWAEELERWDPSFMPKDIHLVFGHQDSLEHLSATPRAVIISYQMLSRLRESMANRTWALMIVDESHNIRCTKKEEKYETKAVLHLASKIDRIVLLSGTPSLSRPFDIYHQINMLWPNMLGNNKFNYAKKYCSLQAARSYQGKIFKDYLRLTELNVLLSQTVMIRRLKEHLLNELPPKRRQIIRLKLKAPDIRTATSSSIKDMNSISCNGTLAVDLPSKSNDENTKDEEDDGCKKSPRHLTPQEIGIAKLSGFSEWFSNHFIMNGLGANQNLDPQSSCQKTIIFAHHLKVLDGIQVFVSDNGIKFVRIDGSTLQRERKEAVDSFRLDPEVKVVIIGITAGGVGLDFSSAQNVVFVELPKSASELLQAEDRAHRRGQTNAVNIYIFCAKNTSDESHWLQLNQSLFRVSSLMNGKKDAIREIEVDQVCHLEEIRNAEEKVECKLHPLENCNTESDDMSFECFPGIEDLELDSDFTIRTIPLEFEDESLGTSLKNNPTPTVLEDRSCIDVSLSPAAAFCTAISSCKSMKARRRLSGNSGTLSQTAPVSDFPIQVESLRFEVSRHTGRIHLYSCVPGDVKSRTLLLKKIPAFCNVFKAFIKEWLALRPIDQSRLLGKPLQLPLSLELCFLKESINHSTQGLLKGGSKRRATPLNDVSNPLPENAEWRQVVLRNGTTKERQYTQGWTIDGEPLCKLCQGLCNGKLAKSPEYFEDLFCGLACFQEYRLRTSGRALRQALFQLERGKCCQCKLDCCKLVKHIKPLPMEKREEYIQKAAPNIASRKKLLDKLVREPTDGNAWHADHIIPVYKGGGECKLENMRTLCVACHYEVTRAQHKELKEIRKKAKEHLKNALNQQQNKASEATEEIDDSFLLVTVPGSAYSTGGGVTGNAHEIVAE
ncbi:DNA annealing helicase and endonuclease ZRANB3 [Panicum miliaceum]|uniref:DNA annealing helicase and endonuclease ZRANB3 n=1 Tax=Panicum miliaceum TaxID=4540 RepID=A0A3L6T761_PANMI|nr:DNA annealing helicase and endonuclease ZRANB3 [Panicum miliaceum]